MNNLIDNNHWVMNYFGKPWVSGAQGPDAYDCFALVRAVQRDVFGIDMPIIMVDALNADVVKKTFSDTSHYATWRQVDVPQEGDCVITKSSPDSPEHVGIWVDIDDGRILQCVFGSGVVLPNVAATKQLIGQHLEYWRHESAC